MGPPCCEVEKRSVRGWVLVYSRQAETEVGLEKGLTAGLVEPGSTWWWQIEVCLSPIDVTLPPMSKFIACLQVGSTSCWPSARIESMYINLSRIKLLEYSRNASSTEPT